MLKSKVLIVIFLSFICQAFGQDKTFESRANSIANRIDSIVASEKKTMKKALKSIDEKVEKELISFEEARSEKNRIAEHHTQRINKAVNSEEQKLKELIHDKVNGTLDQKKESAWRKYFYRGFTEDNLKKDSLTGIYTEKRFTAQAVLALGVSMVVNDEGGYYGEGFGVNPLGFGEVGLTFKYRLKEDSNLWNLKFGFSYMPQNIVPKSDNDIVVTNQDQATLQNSGLDLKKSRLRVSYMALPFHFEVDFSKPQYDRNSDKYYLRSQRSFRLGMGGFFGLRVYSEQVTRFYENGNRITRTEEDNFNLNNFIYGPSAYIGYRDISIYAKYNVNPLFKDNPQNSNSLSIALRLDFN